MHVLASMAQTRVSESCKHANSGATVTLEGGEKFHGRFVVLGDGVHSKAAAKYHKNKLEFMHFVGWRCAHALFLSLFVSFSWSA
jgi:2-polyprenyl-6-methoxyphenol hydroxylase-like FAD-dependent oxidoreductase